MKETFEWEGVNMHDKIPFVYRTLLYLMAIGISAFLLMGAAELAAIWKAIEP